MVAAAAVGADRAAGVAAALAVGALVVGLRYRAAATLSVLLVVAVIVLSDPPALYAALSGLSAAGYLVLRHAASLGVVTTTRPTVLGMVGFTLVGVVATMVPATLPWLPLGGAGGRLGHLRSGHAAAASAVGRPACRMTSKTWCAPGKA